ncbi:MAG: response regulator [Gemmatimonadaceae bacterium]|nr:response regulator [Gemmatimonadaceae bacterium]
MKLDLRSVEQQLDKRGDSAEVREAIRNSRICIIDDRIEDLKGLTDYLRAEGFTNLVEISKVTSVDGLISKNYDLVILDLTGVAGEISQDDGFGVLDSIKTARPALPVLVVTGTTTPPAKVAVVARADLVRAKPVKALELVSDVEALLRPYKDQYWAALEVLKELRRIDADLSGHLSATQRLSLWWRRRQLTSTLRAQSGSAIDAIVAIGQIVGGVAGPALKLVDIAQKFGH